MAHKTSYVQVPPQSTGKKIATAGLTEVPYDNRVGLIALDAILIGQTSGISGTVASAVFATQTSGIVYLQDVEGSFTNDEALQINNTTVATANLPNSGSQVNFDVQKVVIVDPKNPTQVQRVDRFGAQVTTFTDGSPTFGAFGTLSVGEPQINRVYRFATGLEDVKWNTVLTGGATNVWDGAKTTSVLSCSGISGDLAQRTSNFYHPYIPGVGLTFEQTVQCGDDGKTGCRRRWGYFDDNDGFFFELDGTDFYIVKRSSTSGTPVDTRVAQADFNRDRADGSDTVRLTLDHSKANMFWIDVQWYGAGRLRYGMYEPGGTRLSLHEFEHANTSSEYPFTRTATLPVRVEQENTAATAGTSQIRNTGTLVKHTHAVEIVGDKQTGYSDVKTTTLGNEVPLFAVRPKILFNGYTNRCYFEGIAASFTNIVTAGGGPILYRIRACTEAALTNANFVSHGTDSIMEIDKSATALNPAFTLERAAYIVSGGETLFVQNQDVRHLRATEISLNADGVTQPVLLITAECLSGTSADAIALVNWEEVKF